MGMFDNLRCLYPLPISGASERTFQTKDTPAQFRDNYEIREDGTLWHEEYDTEDQSDPTKTGVGRIIGMLASVNERWVQVQFTGEIRFYDFENDPLGGQPSGWIEFSAYFKDGQLQQVNRIAGI